MLRILLGMLLMTGYASAQVTMQHTYTKGDELKYQVKQETTVDETTLDPKTKKPTTLKTVTTLALSKTWKVVAVTADGSATLELVITSIKDDLVQTQDDEKPKTRSMDSSKPDDAKDMPFLNTTSLSVTLDKAGELVGAKGATKQMEAKLREQLPFRAVLPTKAVNVKDTWKREFTITTPTKEAFDTVQEFSLKGRNADYLVMGMTTALKEKITDDSIIPMVAPLLWNGDVFFNGKTNQYHGAKLKAGQDIKNHRGEGTKFKYSSEFTEVMVAK
jgi:hypothetical protein